MTKRLQDIVLSKKFVVLENDRALPKMFLHENEYCFSIISNESCALCVIVDYNVNRFSNCLALVQQAAPVCAHRRGGISSPRFINPLT